MRLNWEVTEYKVLRAARGDAAYFVVPGAVNTWKPSRHELDAAGELRATGPEHGMALADAVGWCETDADLAELALPADRLPELDIAGLRARADAAAKAVGVVVPEGASVEDRLNAIEWYLATGPKPDGGLRLELHRTFLEGRP